MKNMITLSVFIFIFSFYSFAQSPKLSAYTSKKKPVRTYKMGKTSIAVWETEKKGKFGKYTLKNFKVVKSYKKDEEWKETNYYSMEELLQLKAIIEKAILEEGVKNKEIE